MNTKGIFSHKTDEWETPSGFFKDLDAEFHFTLDPCATEQNRKCEKFFTVKENGLKMAWGGYAVFCNPPYSQCYEWAKKCYEESQNGATVVMLVPSRTDTKWFHEWVYGKAEIRFIRGRLKFGNGKTGAPFPSMLAIYRPPEREKEHDPNITL